MSFLKLVAACFFTLGYVQKITSAEILRHPHPVRGDIG